MRSPRLLLSIGGVLALGGLPRFEAQADLNDAEGAPSITFEHDVRPILKEFCFDCHGAERELKGGLDLRLRRSLVAGSENGSIIALGHGKPERSVMIDLLERGEMPPSGKKVPPEKVEVIRRWIDAGAPTAGPEPASLAPGEVYITPEDRAYWAFQPIRRPEIEKARARWCSDQSERVRTPIDAVIQATMQSTSSDSVFSSDADRRTLIRRMSLGLTGLPPSPKEIADFLNDPSDDAYDALVDRLLASPHYGERWGRHWLDVAGYADSEGATNADARRAWAWKYRDYVIRALNEDKPFDQFVLEQLAGDELVPRPHKNLSEAGIELLTATGFLRMAADGTGSGDDSEAARNKTVGDTLKIVSSAFLGLTLECAQCHDHRYDPIPQRDYFQVRAIFEPAFNPKQWLRPSDRLISLYTDADHQRAAEVEEEARDILQERDQKRKAYIDEALQKEVQQFPEDLRPLLVAAHGTPTNKRSPEQVALLKRYPSANITGGNLYQYNQKAADEIKAYDARVAKVRAKKPFHGYVRALTEPPDVTTESRLFHRGDYRQPVGESLAPAALTITAPVGRRLVISERASPESSGRRTAFAKWLTNGEHPLVARVLVNRVWMHHFGTGLVETPGDFGVLGDRPDHPELLDLLAHEFMANGWSLKRLHRLIVRSTVYRQRARSMHDHEQDGPSHSFSTWPIQRLDAETIRDRCLAVSGQLDRTFFGEPIPLKENDAGQFALVSPRRSLYASWRRSQPVTLLTSFDAPVMESNCNRRPNSNSAIQALMVMNGDFHLQAAARFADRVVRDVERGWWAGETLVGAEVLLADFSVGQPSDANLHVARAFELAYGRPATRAERRRALSFISSQMSSTSEAAPNEDLTEIYHKALTSCCHALISSNEFLYVD